MLKKLRNDCKEKWNNILMNRFQKIKKKDKYILWIMLFISLLGFCSFYVVPFVLSFFYSMMENPITKEYCGFNNYTLLFCNTYFIKGLKNTAIFMLTGIPLNMIISFTAAMIVRNEKKYSGLYGFLFLIPLVIPSATSAFFWKNFFCRQGVFNRFLSIFHITGLDWLDCKYSMLIMVIIFLWKNVGYNMTLFLSGLANIPRQYYEYAEVEGAGCLWCFKHITLVYMTPTIFLALIMSFVNSFKIFKEIYLITGDYPPDSLYVLQHYMNNMFMSLDYPKLASAIYILTLVVVLFVVCIFRMEKNVSENLHE